MTKGQVGHAPGPVQPVAPDLGQYFTTEELCRLLPGNPSRRTIDRWRANGEGPPPTHIGCRIYFRKEAVKEWLEAREEQPRKRQRRRRRAGR